MNAAEALEQLEQGNHRYVTDTRTRSTRSSDPHRTRLAAGQQPFAVIIGCADSRVPPELVFDQHLGDLFVIRVAGNIATPALIGSVEYAVGQLGTRLVVVLGHSQCGAVGATVDVLLHPPETLSPNLSAIVDAIRPAVIPLLPTDGAIDRPALVDEGVRANVQHTMTQLQSRSSLIQDLVAHDGLQVVGAEYALDTGEVAFLPPLS